MSRVMVFVYGTLLTGERNFSVIRPFLIQSFPGTIKGQMVNVGAFPAVIQDGEELIHGEWMLIHEEGLAATDQLEGYNGPGKNNFYERVWTHDVFGDQEGYVYVWKQNRRNLPIISCGSWRERNRTA